MAINMMCMNSDCKYYWEDNCMRNINEERIEIDENGKCETFEEGVNELYNCEFSKDNKCQHCNSDGELICKEEQQDKDKCSLYNEVGGI
jgi:hypothetical protein